MSGRTFFCLIFLSWKSVFTQSNQPQKLYPGNSDSTNAVLENEKIKVIELDFEVKPGEVKVMKDNRIQSLIEFLGSAQKGDAGVRIKGFRVQIFFDTDKENVNQKRSDYLARHGENAAYVDYLAPNFRLRTGNFRTRLQAQYWQNEIAVDFPDAIIVEDWIELPKLKQ